MTDSVFRLFACCLPVKGARRSTLCDLQRQAYRLIPNGLYEILTTHKGKTVDQIKAEYGFRFDSEIDEYFSFLEREEFGFWCDSPADFPDLSLAWETPEIISNAIIDVGTSSHHDFVSIFRQLDDLGCRALQIRFFREVSLAALQVLLNGAESGKLRSIDLLAPYSDGWRPQDLEQFCVNNPRVSNFQVHSSPRQSQHRIGETVQILFSPQIIESSAHCGVVRPEYFVTNLPLFSESQAHNNCLNKKISIDVSGEIRNCPSIARSFGNIRDTSLHTALLHSSFRELWEINKDQVEICKDCEFRYMCSDCRAFIQTPENLYSKPSKCSYDPYTAAWT